jgi:hypothetical protein
MVSHNCGFAFCGHGRLFHRPAFIYGEAMKVEFKTVHELQAFIRGHMLSNMYDSVKSMQQCGCSEEEIQDLCDDTMEKIEEALDEAAQMFAAAQEEFNAPITIN